MHLPEALRTQRERFLREAPPEVVATLEKATDDLSRCGIVHNCLQPDATAPDFSLEDENNVKIKLYEELRKGPVVINFFRGDW